MQHPLAQDNIRFLEQALALVRNLAPHLHRQPVPEASGVGLGSHLRHLYDHYRLFLQGLETGRVDYDRRQRDPLIEEDRDHCLARFTVLLGELRAIPPDRDQAPLEVHMDCGGDRDRAGWSRSTVKRELDYLAMHDVHHFALIAFMLRAQGVEPPADFGVAPATLRHRERE